MADNTWHDYSPKLRQMIAADDKVGFDAFITLILGEPTTVITPTLIWRTPVPSPDPKKPLPPCSSMWQMDLALPLAIAGLKWGNAYYLDLARQVANVVTLRKSNGGLRSNKGCWLYSSTGGGGPGWCLNQHVDAGLDLLDMGNLLAEVAYSEVGFQAIEQLGRQNSQPNLWSFVVQSVTGTYQTKSWLYYDLNEDRTGDFLSGDKNGGYTIRTMKILYRASLRGGVNFSGMASAIRFIAKSYRKKGNIYVDSQACTGGDWRGVPAKDEPLTPEELAWMEGL